MHPRIRLSLTSALLVITACATKNVSDYGEGDEGSETAGDTNSNESADAAETGEPLEPMCTLENYAGSSVINAAIWSPLTLLSDRSPVGRCASLASRVCRT